MLESASTCIASECDFKFTYTLPQSQEIRKKWFQKLNRPDLGPTSAGVICYKHFHDHDLSYVKLKSGNVKQRRTLNPTGIPSLLLFDKTKDQTSLTTHIETVHEGKKPFNCHICNYKSSGRGTLNRHIASVHEGKKPFNCSICDYNCSQKGNLTIHIASVHEGNKEFKCSICYFNCI